MTTGTESSALVDGFGRVHRDLRISVTDRCNFRCTYCMPAEGMDWHPRSELLTFEELTRVATVCVERFGFDSIRLTGGEPTVRARLPLLVEKLAALDVDLSLTTNGSTMTSLAHDLKVAGLDRMNISLDSLRPDRFVELTRRDELPGVLDGIRAAVAAGFDPVKVNVVVVRGVNDDEVVDFARFGRDEGVTVRFIEFMPLDAEHNWTTSQVVPSAEIVAAIGAVFPLEIAARGSDPAERHVYVDGRGEIGVIGTGHRAVLFIMRSSPAHCRRSVAGLPLRHRRDRSPSHPPLGRHRRRPGSGDRHHGQGQVGRPRHQQRQLHPSGEVHERDRRLIPSRSGRLLADWALERAAGRISHAAPERAPIVLPVGDVDRNGTGGQASVGIEPLRQVAVDELAALLGHEDGAFLLVGRANESSRLEVYRPDEFQGVQLAALDLVPPEEFAGDLVRRVVGRAITNRPGRFRVAIADERPTVIGHLRLVLGREEERSGSDHGDEGHDYDAEDEEDRGPRPGATAGDLGPRQDRGVGR